MGVGNRYFSVSMFLLFMAVCASAVASKPGMEFPACDHPDVFRVADSMQLSGLFRAGVNDAGDLVLVFDSDGSGSATKAFHVALIKGQEASVIADLMADTNVVAQLLVRRGRYLTEMVFQQPEREGLVVSASTLGCTRAELPVQFGNIAHVFQARAVAIYSFPPGRHAVEAVINDFSDRPLILSEETISARYESDSPELSQPLGSGPVWCQAGGPGAISCSWSAGGIGGITAGSCSITCPAWQYACCGFAFGKNCVCRAYDENNPFPSPPPGWPPNPTPPPPDWPPFPPPGDGDDDDEDGDDEERGVGN